MQKGEKEELEAWKVAPLGDLVRHIVGVCHLECRVDMARLETLVELAAMEEGGMSPALLDVRDMVSRFCTGMRAHLALEERNLFPYILESQEGGVGPARKDALIPLKGLLEGDHEAEAGLLRAIRGLSSALGASGGPQSSQGRIHQNLLEFSERLQKHLYLENQILFPRTR